MTTVVRTPEFSIATIVQPFWGFEQKYQGVPAADNPIAIPGSLDFAAGKYGYAQNLLAGIPVPMGSDVIIYLPKILAPYQAAVAPSIYSYTLVWRVRALTEATSDPQGRVVGNFGQLLLGNPAQTGFDQGPRYVLAAAQETVSYPQPEPTNPNDSGTNRVRSVATQILGGEWQAPLSPNFPNQSPWPGPGGTVPASAKLQAAGLLTQGLYPDQDVSGTGDDWSRAGWRAGPNYLGITRKCLGNELIVLVNKFGVSANWDFRSGEEDFWFSWFLGNANGQRTTPMPNVGVQIYTGSLT